MVAWIFGSEAYTQRYHEIFAEFLEDYFDSGVFAETIDRVTEMITPYVEKDPTKFCTMEEFTTGAATLKTFCLLRAESVRGQLDGSGALADASDIQLADMGSMNMGGMNNGGPGPRQQNTAADLVDRRD